MRVILLQRTMAIISNTYERPAEATASLQSNSRPALLWSHIRFNESASGTSTSGVQCLATSRRSFTLIVQRTHVESWCICTVRLGGNLHNHNLEACLSTQLEILDLPHPVYTTPSWTNPPQLSTPTPLTPSARYQTHLRPPMSMITAKSASPRSGQTRLRTRLRTSERPRSTRRPGEPDSREVGR